MSQNNTPQLEQESVTGQLTRLGPWSIGSRLLVNVFVFTASIIIVRVLSKDEYGAYTFLKTCWIYAWMLGQLGLSYTVLRFASEMAKKGGIFGLKRLLKKCFLFQALSVAVMMAGFTVAGIFLEPVYHIGPALMALMVFWAAIQMWKETAKQVYIAYYRIKFVAVISVISVLFFPILAYLLLVVLKIGPAGAILAEMFIYSIMIVCYVIAFRKLTSHINELSAGVPERESYEISNSRIFKYAGAFVGNQAISMLFAKHMIVIVIFFYFGREITGIFGLATEVPEYAVMLLLTPLMGLIMATLTRAYSEDKSRMPSLISSYCKMMMVALLPISFISIVFMDKIMILTYGDKGAAAGQLARISFVLFVHIIIATPTTTALNLLEKAHLLVPLRVLIGVIYMGMIIGGLMVWRDIPVICDMGLLGPLYVVIAASVLKTIFLLPVLLLVARRIIGGLYFPVPYFFRALAASSVILLLWPLRWLWDYVAYQPDLPLGSRYQYCGSIAMLFFVLFMCLIFVVAGVRVFRLFQKDEVRYFLDAQIPGRTLLMRLLVSRRYRPA